MLNKKLLSLLLILTTIVAYVWWKDSNSTISTFKKDIININTSDVTKLVIHPKSNKQETIELTLTDSLWYINLLDSGIIEANQDIVKQLVNSLNFSAERVVATTEDKWVYYQVDTLASTKVKVYEKNNKETEFYLGKFTVDQERSMITSYVRIPNDIHTYAINGQHAYSFDQQSNQFIKQKN